MVVSVEIEVHSGSLALFSDAFLHILSHKNIFIIESGFNHWRWFFSLFPTAHSTKIYLVLLPIFKDKIFIGGVECCGYWPLYVAISSREHIVECQSFFGGLTLIFLLTV